MKIIVLSVILILCLNKSFADDCKKNNQRKENQNTVFLYLNCKEAQENCLKLDDQDKKTIDLVASSKVSLSVKSASLNSDNIVITFDKNSAKCLEKFTGDNVGKVIAIVARDIILINATIGAKMSDGLVQISMGSGTTNDQKLELCKSIFKNCQFNESSDKKNNTDLADLLFKHLPNDKDYAKMNQK